MTTPSKEELQARREEQLKASTEQGSYRSPKGERLVMHRAVPWGRLDLPVVVFLHGALRMSSDLVHWVEMLRDVADVLLVDLPGHQGSTYIRPPSVDRMAEWVHEGLRVGLAGRRVLVVGESLGGLLALRMAGDAGPSPIRAVLAVDPPMTTSKQWTITTTFKPLLKARGPGALAEFAAANFGIMEDRLEERIYYPLLADLKRPVTLATGDNPLMPPRSYGVIMPCLIDELDRYVFDTYYPGAIDVRTVPGGGHLLLHDVVDPMRALIVDMLERHVSA